MKSIRIFSAFALTLSILFSGSPAVYAEVNDASIVSASRPTLTDLELAIKKVTQITDYQTFFPSDDSAPLTISNTKFYREYNYLRTIVTTANFYIENYDSTSDEKLTEVIKAADDAAISCVYLFNTPKPATKSPAPETSAQTSTFQSTAPIVQAISSTSTQKPTIASTNSLPKTSVEISHTNDSATTSVAENPTSSTENTLAPPSSTKDTLALTDSNSPMKNSTESNPTDETPNFLIPGVIAVAVCALIGLIVIRLRRASHHPKSRSRR